uniref:Poly [ADP-ribose] polymerase n=1 Tax=Amphiprion percula TaxID=161767 RepID=A0A3P8RT22_AMPPE
MQRMRTGGVSYKSRGNLASLSETATTVASYSLQDGLQVLVCEGDITKQNVDALVNAANEDLDHHGGVAAALSKAGGPEVQKESSTLVKYMGKIPTGDVVVTTGGNLNCKTLLHAVGPVGGKAGGREKILLEQTVQKALNLSEMMEFQSIAIPCISSGVFGVPVTVCCEAIVTAVRKYFESPSGRDSILSVAQSKKCLMRLEEQPHASRQNSGFGKYSLQDGLQVLVCEGDITKQYTDVLVNAANEDLDHHGGVAAALSKAGGPEVQKESKALVKRTGKIKTGDVVVTTGGNLKCKKLLHAVGPIGGKAGGKERDVNGIFADISMWIHKSCLYIPSGAAGMDADKACRAMLDGMSSAIQGLKPSSLSLIRISDAGMSHHILQTIFFYECVSKILILILVASASALRLPEHWDPMQEEVFKKVELQPNSPEYQDVAQGFFKTAKYNISKIERVQNLYLWHSYSVCRQRILTKNGEAELGEKFLYHGTSAESCNCIERDRFDRSFAGAHAAMYGKGVYFAVDANYSASRYSPADPSGLKRLYVARVLTGRYTVGTSSMKATPPRGSDPTDCFDSLVNNQQQPSMFVIFHDDQAYPEYLITFS